MHLVTHLCHGRLSTNAKLSDGQQFLETYGVTSYGSSWKKDVLNLWCNQLQQWLEEGCLKPMV